MKTLLMLTMLLNFCNADIDRSESISTRNQNIDTKDKRESVKKDIIRLLPKEFTNLPMEIITDLEKRECTIPQSYNEKEKHNVIKGEFKQKGQTDFAILCSKNKASTILVYWNKSAKDVAEVAKQEDDDFLQEDMERVLEFSRVLDVADAKYINEHYEMYGGLKPPKIKHQAINDIFAEKASIVRYFDGKKWLELQGAD